MSGSEYDWRDMMTPYSTMVKLRREALEALIGGEEQYTLSRECLLNLLERVWEMGRRD